jgi:hypothetical protein
MNDADRLALARMTLAVAEANARIENCHTEVACPACGAPVGTRCWRLSGRGFALRGSPHLLHPHRRRWTQVVAPR